MGNDVSYAPATEDRSPVASATFWHSATQGVRGIAVLGVLLYHASLPLPGGYLGVDVFFVISGFVITGAIIRQVDRQGQFRFWSFSWRRFRRLVPALSLLVSIDLLLSGLLLPPSAELQSVVLTGIGAVLGIANVVIAKTTGGYFEPTADYNSLLHTWSLSVEQQFYLFFPLLFMFVLLVSRKRLNAKLLLILVVIVTAISFTIAVLEVLGFPNRIGVYLFDNNVFYSPVGRAWEFAAGSVAYIVSTKFPISIHPLVSKVGVWAGVSALGLCFALPLSFEPISLIRTALAVVATAGILLICRQVTPPGSSALLANRPLVAIGNASYSLYLWHWPFVSFALWFWPRSWLAPLVATLVALGPALLSYHFVERKVRGLKLKSAAEKFSVIALCIAPPLLVASTLMITDGQQWRYNLGLSSRVSITGPVGDIEFKKALDALTYPCGDWISHVTSDLGEYGMPLSCRQTRDAGPQSTLVLGDSQADAVFFGLVQADAANGVVLLSLPSTAPLVESSAVMDRAIAMIEKEPFSSIVIAGHWTYYTDTDDRDFSRRLEATTRILTKEQRKVVYVYGFPHFSFHPSQCLRLAPAIPYNRCEEEMPHVFARHKEVDTQFLRLKEVSSINVVSVWDQWCSEERCSMRLDDELLFRDQWHLNAIGAGWMIETFDERVITERFDLKPAA